MTQDEQEAVEHLATIAQDVVEWLGRTDRRGTAHEQALATALDTYRAATAAAEKHRDDFHHHVAALVRQITYREGYWLLVERDKSHHDGRTYLQVEHERPDSTTGAVARGRGGKAYLSRHMTDSEIVKVAFGLFKSYEEHEAREFFRYRGAAVFGPHIDVSYLVDIARCTDHRD